MSEQPTGPERAAPSAKVTISENALMQEMGDEAVILNVNNERYYGIDDVGINFWNWLKEERDVDRVLDRAIERYGVDEEILKKDIGVFVVELHHAGLLTFDES